MDDFVLRREDAQIWFEYARRDRALARRALQDPPFEEGGLFHSQQAAEKALKAYLILAGASDIPRTHLLRNLVRMLDALGVATPSPDAVRFLDVHSVSVRYPDTPRPDVETVQLAMEQAAEDLYFVQAQMEFLDRLYEQAAEDNPRSGEGHATG